MTPPGPLDDITEDEMITILEDLIRDGHIKAEYNEQDDDAFLVPTSDD